MKIKITHTFTTTGLFLVLALTSCTRSCSRHEETQEGPRVPDDIVKSFIELSASVKEAGDKQKLEKLCSGEMRRAFERMTDEVFKIAYVGNNVKISSLKIQESTTENDTAKVRYEVSIENTQGTDSTKEISEREVDLTRAQGTWSIDSIRLRGTDKIAFLNGMMF